MSNTKFLLPLGLALVCAAASCAESAKAQILPPPVVNGCNEKAALGASDACHAAAAVLFLPDPDPGFSTLRLGASDTSVTGNALQYQNPHIITTLPLTFTGTGMAEVTTNTELKVHNSCQLDVDGSLGGEVISLFPTALFCAGAFQDEVVATNPDGSAADLGPLTFVWEIKDVLLETGITFLDQQDIPSTEMQEIAIFSFASSADLENAPPVKKITLTQSTESCFLDGIAFTLTVNNTCEYTIPQTLVPIVVAPTSGTTNHYVFAGAASAVVANGSIFTLSPTSGFSAFSRVRNNNTVTLKSILKNGSTKPEKEGMNLNFASGIISPNQVEPATSVPEPTSSLSFLVLGTLGAGLTLKRQLKK